ncbi:hypothetical protein ACQ4M4_12740 [Leptolyngbya sp. AN02str]|uniref:hypothetical protein n=1 Tax=Leptolyngbya sp. AN02str TaxID=3423363 RepID=UPI003D31AFB4
MNQGTGLEASTSTRCPLCDRDHYCYLVQDDNGTIFKAICQWTEQAEGWDRAGTAKDGRGIFVKHGYNRAKRKHFPDFVSLSPRPIPADIPQWQPTDPGDRPIVPGDLVAFKSGTPDSLFVVHKTRGGERQGQWQTLITATPYGATYASTWDIVEGDIKIATTDPQTGDVEQVIEYLYPHHDGTPLGKVERRQWSDRRSVYCERKKSKPKSKQIRPYHWVGRIDEGMWSQGKGDRTWPLYREAEAKEEILRGGMVFVVAGEQAVECYRLLGLVATTCQGGESNFKEIIERLAEAFHIAKGDGQKPMLVIHPDHDITGENKFSELQRECDFAKIPAVTLDPTDLWPEMPVGGDIWNLLYQANLTPEQVIRTLETAIDEAIDRQENEIFARQQRERWQAPEAYRGELGFWKEDKETCKRYFRPQADFDFQVERELISEEGGGLVLQVKRADDSSQRRVYLKSADYSSVQCLHRCAQAIARWRHCLQPQQLFTPIADPGSFARISPHSPGQSLSAHRSRGSTV